MNSDSSGIIISYFNHQLNVIILWVFVGRFLIVSEKLIFNYRINIDSFHKYYFCVKNCNNSNLFINSNQFYYYYYYQYSWKINYLNYIDKKWIISIFYVDSFGTNEKFLKF